MTKPKSDLSAKTDAELEHEVHDLEAEHDAMRSIRKRPFRADSHEAIDTTVAGAKAAIDRLLTDALPRLASSGGTVVWLPGLADAWVLAFDPSIAARWHELVDGDGFTYSALDRTEYEAERTRLQDEVARRRAELRRRELIRQRAALDAELGDVQA